MRGEVLSVNLADVRTVQHRGKPVKTGIWKLPAAGRIATGPLGLAGDVQADRTVHGGVDMAIYAYAREEIVWWESELDRSLVNGTFGENLTLQDVEVSGALIGERWRIGDTLCEVCAPRIPCYKLGIKMGDPRFLKRFARALRPGAYLRVIENGTIAAGDAVEIVARPAHDVSVRLVAEAMQHDRSLAPRLLAAPALAADVREWAQSRA